MESRESTWINTYQLFFFIQPSFRLELLGVLSPDRLVSALAERMKINLISFTDWCTIRQSIICKRLLSVSRDCRVQTKHLVQSKICYSVVPIKTNVVVYLKTYTACEYFIFWIHSYNFTESSSISSVIYSLISSISLFSIRGYCIIL